MDAPSATYLVSDDPLDGSQEIVTIYVRSASSTVPVSDAVIYDEVPYLAFVSVGSGTVTQVGPGPAQAQPRR
jgi:hypothetical protein